MFIVAFGGDWKGLVVVGAVAILVLVVVFFGRRGGKYVARNR